SCSRLSTFSASVCTPTLSRPQLGQAIMIGPRSRKPSDLRISKAVLISSTGSAVSETRIVSPIPSTSSAPMPTALLIEPENGVPRERDLVGAADVAGVDAHSGDAALDRLQREARVEVDVCDHRQR